jgi:hypothetical protein
MTTLQIDANGSWGREELAIMKLVTNYKIADIMATGSTKAA